MWLGCLGTLSKSQLHLRIYDHSAAVAIGLWTLCLMLSIVVARVVTVVLSKAMRSRVALGAS
jgi:hypothetical protein